MDVSLRVGSAGTRGRGLGCVLFRSGVLSPQAFGMLPVCTMHCLHTCTPTDTHPWVYTPARGLGVALEVVYKHTLGAFTHINMLVYTPTDTL